MGLNESLDNSIAADSQAQDALRQNAEAYQLAEAAAQDVPQTLQPQLTQPGEGTAGVPFAELTQSGEDMAGGAKTEPLSAGDTPGDSTAASTVSTEASTVSAAASAVDAECHGGEEDAAKAVEYMIDAEGLVKIYKTKETEVLALSGLDLKIEKGEFTALIGNSGSGKSTFLNIIGGLDVPSAGKLYVGGKNLFRMTERERVRYKRDTVGFVWQNNARNLFPYLTAIDNVCIPMRISGVKHKKQKAEHLLELVGMINHRNDRLGTLSGGEQQRIAIAIALANSPGLLLADEPTGSVDERTGDQIFEIFTRLNEAGQTILVVTHDLALSRKVRRVVAIRDGRISSERILKESFADRLKESGVDWRNEETQEEYVVVDRAGRLQLPADMIEKLGNNPGRLVVTYEDGQIRLKSPG